MDFYCITLRNYIDRLTFVINMSEFCWKLTQKVYMLNFLYPYLTQWFRWHFKCSFCITLIKLGNRHKRISMVIMLFSEYFFKIYSEVAVFLCDVIHSCSDEVLHNLGFSSMEKNHICLSHTMLFSVYKRAEFRCQSAEILQTPLVDVKLLWSHSQEK